MGKIRLTLGIVAYLTTLGTGCTSSGQDGEVKEVGPGSYSIGVSRTLGGAMLQGDEALKATVDKAGERCHAKGQSSRTRGPLTTGSPSGASRESRSRNDFNKRASARSIWMRDCSEPRSPAEMDRVGADRSPSFNPDEI